MSPRLLALPMLCAALTCLAMGCSSRSSDPPGVLDGHLAPCPDRPNCVCSDCEPDLSDRKIAPFAYSGSRQTAMQQLAELLSNMSRVTVVTVTEDALYAAFRSRLFGCVDDVEFFAI